LLLQILDDWYYWYDQFGQQPLRGFTAGDYLVLDPVLDIVTADLGTAFADDFDTIVAVGYTHCCYCVGYYSLNTSSFLIVYCSLMLLSAKELANKPCCYCCQELVLVYFWSGSIREFTTYCKTTAQLPCCQLS
jgi:hypothetical protein